MDSLRVKSKNPIQAMASIRTISTAGFGMALIAAPIMRTIAARRHSSFARIRKDKE